MSAKRRPEAATSFRIRRAVEADAAELLRLARALARHENNPDDLLTEAMVLGDMISPDGAMDVLVAARQRGLAGYISLLPAFESSHASRGLYVADLFVDEDMRGNGIGRALMEAAAAFARGKNGTHLWLVMQPGNADADSFYRRIADVREPVVAHAVTRQAFRALADAGRKRIDDIARRADHGERG